MFPVLKVLRIAYLLLKKGHDAGLYDIKGKHIPGPKALAKHLENR